MYKTTVLKYFRKKNGITAENGGVTAAAKCLGITKGAVSQWDKVVPELMARKLHERTQGELKFNSSLYQ